METEVTELKENNIGKLCVVKERTKLTDRGSYVGVIVGYDADTVYVMNFNGVHKTKEHCIIKYPVEIGNYYNVLKDELKRMNKLVKKYEKSMLATEKPLYKKSMYWDSYVKSNIFTDRQKKLTNEKIEALANITDIVEEKRERYNEYQSYKWYLENLIEDIRQYIRY
jgi:hypothetical protein